MFGNLKRVRDVQLHTLFQNEYIRRRTVEVDIAKQRTPNRWASFDGAGVCVGQLKGAEHLKIRMLLPVLLQRALPAYL